MKDCDFPYLEMNIPKIAVLVFARVQGFEKVWTSTHLFLDVSLSDLLSRNFPPSFGFSRNYVIVQCYTFTFYFCHILSWPEKKGIVAKSRKSAKYEGSVFRWICACFARWLRLRKLTFVPITADTAITWAVSLMTRCAILLEQSWTIFKILCCSNALHQDPWYQCMENWWKLHERKVWNDLRSWWSWWIESHWSATSNVDWWWLMRIGRRKKWMRTCQSRISVALANLKWVHHGHGG